MTDPKKPQSDLDRLIREEGGKFDSARSVFQSEGNKDKESSNAVNAFKAKMGSAQEESEKDDRAAAIQEQLDEMREGPEAESTDVTQKRLSRGQLEQIVMAVQARTLEFENSLEVKKLERRKRRIERLEKIEERLENLDLRSFFMRGHVTQNVPVNKYLEIVFFTPSFETQNLAQIVGNDLLEDRGLTSMDPKGLPEPVRQQEESDFHDRRATVYGAASLATYLEQVNGDMLYGMPASAIEAIKEAEEKKKAIREKAESILNIGASMMSELVTHQGAFIARVQNALEDVPLLEQERGNS